jgi:hypothetical protein
VPELTTGQRGCVPQVMANVRSLFRMKRKNLTALASCALVAVLVLLVFLLEPASWGERRHPVAGQLVWEDGQPARELAGSMIYFECLEQRSLSRSKVKEDGSFQLTTEEPETRGTDGAPPGQYRVYVIDGRPPRIERRFCRPDTSGLEVTVPPDGPVILKVERNREQPSPPSSTP